MNTKARLFVIALCFVMGAGLAYVLVSKRTASPAVVEQSSSEQRKNEQDQEEAPVVSSAQKGEYVEYSADKVARTKGTKLLFFHAPWCPQCRELDASIKSSALPGSLTIFKVDYDTNQTLRTKYGVTIQTTIVKINDNGDKVASYVAYDKPTFLSVEQALLK